MSKNYTLAGYKANHLYKLFNMAQAKKSAAKKKAPAKKAAAKKKAPAKKAASKSKGKK
ncbi:MAG: hypothetical protein K5793_05890 [Nitrosarchaeum sp.]|nr:hypothetical protein [Nitrosarchaeum sp.]MCV0398616.1 hypothetical protein [Nitrosarchaeum sp.]